VRCSVVLKFGRLEADIVVVIKNQHKPVLRHANYN